MRLTRRSILRTGTLAAVSPLFGQAPWPATPARAQSSEPQWRHGLSLFGDLKYPPGFRHFDYVNPQAPKGGAVRLVALGTFDNFNQVIAGAQGLVRCGCRHDLRHVDGAVARRSVDPLRADRGSGQSPPELCVHLLSLARRRSPPRRQADYGRGRDLFLRGLQEIQPLHRRLLPPRREGRAERRARGHFHSRFPRQSGNAGDPRATQSTAQALVGRKRRVGQEARHRRNHARAAARQWRLPHQGIRRRPHRWFTSG